MMRRKFVIVGLILLLVGSAMLGWVLAGRWQQQQRVARYKLKYDSETNDYLSQYNEWLRLPPQERTNLPPVLDKYVKARTESELRQEQQERLKADVDKLAAGETVGDPIADILYGDNWQDEVDAYKERQEQSELVLTGSIVCASMGGSILTWCLLLWTAGLGVRGVSSSREFLAHVFSNRQQQEAEQLTVADEEVSDQQQKPPEQHAEANARPKISVNTDPEHPARSMSRSEETRKTTEKTKTSGRPQKIAVLLSDEKAPESAMPVQGRTVHLDTNEEAKPLDDTLEELTEQVSAIRQYTAFQQDRLEKLQDGYDWNIVRTFCLRIIRCIDNIESRIDRMADHDAETTDLEEVRDELIFALESGGVEQYEPKLNSDYRGQEKYAEAVKDKQRGAKAKQRGKIAKVTRPGYRYFIDEENAKVVRPAQVKLFA